jgi:hypothetical protein
VHLEQGDVVRIWALIARAGVSEDAVLTPYISILKPRIPSPEN